MKRIFYVFFLGGSLVCVSYGMETDVILIADSVKTGGADTAHVSFDSTSLLSRPTQMRADTMSKISVDTISSRKDTVNIENSVQPSAPSELKILPATNSSLDPNGYRDTHWGMTMQEAKNYLADHNDLNDDQTDAITNGFEYPGLVAGVKTTIAYQFDSDRLYIVRLTPQVKASSKFDFMDSFDDYQTTLEAKYGKPARSGFHKTDESYLNTIESIQLGFAKKYALWEFERSYIILILTGHSKRLELHITYLSRTIFDEMKNRVETLKLEDF